MPIIVTKPKGDINVGGDGMVMIAKVVMVAVMSGSL